MNSPREGADAYDAGDIVKVGDEAMLSVVVIPTDRAADCLPDGTPDLGAVCCVSIALVRTPIDKGVLRWVGLCDLTCFDSESSVPGNGASAIFGEVRDAATDGNRT